jgi:hypothetical protein
MVRIKKATIPIKLQMFLRTNTTEGEFLPLLIQRKGVNMESK